jgi:hypothetical protein
VQDNIKLGLQETTYEGVSWINVAQCLMVFFFCEHGNKPVISIKARALLSSLTVSVTCSRNSVFISLKYYFSSLLA